ncbi:hypothetical protein LK994_12660 [Ferruginibacter lapsinanis]|uniref:beta strand repeat-containing protein n=1 Tax=Ferruginibacter lapsinanis TaxID=563172 RepID=UPI001E2C7F33|nr:hypothetical protein [Ferruginibacter lapsinanis]UEG49485.1 hypothetical protein LK994_12660 [Ferruginibacter lapsinanis]
MKNKFTPLLFKVVILIIIGAFFISTHTNAQVINEGFEEAGWVTSTNSLGNQTVVINTTGTASINNGSWIYNGGSVNSVAASSIAGTKDFWLAGSSNNFIITPIINAGVSVVTVVVKGATGTVPNMIIGFATNLTVTANTGSISSSGAGNAFSINSSIYTGLPVLGGSPVTLTFSVTHSGGSNPGYVKFQRSATGQLLIDDIIVMPFCTLPVFSTQPSTSAQTVCQGGSATALTVAASPVASYQWYSNASNSNSGGTLISGATSASYTPSSATAGALYYYCEALNGGSCVTKSNVSGLITINATSVGGSVGSNATVCTGSNSGTLTLTGKTGTVDKWQSATVSDFSSYTDIANTTTSQSYTNIGATTYYRAVVSNGVCPASNSSAATITVTTAPDLSNLSTSVAAGCQGTAFAVTLTSSSLASKTYTVTYDLTGANTGTGLTASVTMSGGTGSFNTGSLANSGSTTITITSIAEGSCSSAPGGATGTATFTVSAFPTITLGTNPTVCYSASSQTANLSYSATTSSPTTYSISGWSGGSFANVTNAALAAAPSNIAITVPAGTAAGTYTANLTVSGTCTSSNYAISVTVNQVTVTPTSQTVAFGATSMSLPVSTTGSPNEYSIDFADASFTDIAYTTLSGSPITPIAIPAKSTNTPFNATITVRNTTTGCASPATAFTVTYGTLATHSFRSAVTTGDWSVAANWESSADLVNWYTSTLAPDYQSKGITIMPSHTISIASGTVVADSLKVKSGGTLVLVDGATLTPNDDAALTNDIEIEGTFENRTVASPSFGSTGSMKILDGGTYKLKGYTGNGQIVFTNVTFNAGTTGGTLYIATGVPRLPFANSGNVIWDSPSSSNTFLTGTNSTTVIGGNFTIKSTGAGGINNGSSNVGRTLSVTNNMIIEAGEYYLVGTSTGNNIAANFTTTVAGDITISGGTLGIYNSTVGYTSGTFTLTGKNITISGGNLYTIMTGVPAASNVILNIKGDLLHTSGNFGNNATGLSALINFNGTVAQNISTTGLIAVGTNNVTIGNTDATTGVTLNSDMNINGVLNITSASGGDFRVSNVDRFAAARNNTLTISYNGGSPINIGTGRTFNVDGTVANTGYTGGSVLNKVGTAVVNFNAGSTYKHAVNAGAMAIPTTWNTTSTAWITGTVGNAPISTTFNQNFGNVTWECAGQSQNINLTNPSSFVINGDLTIKNTNGSYLRLGGTNAAATITANKKLILNGGNLGIGTGTVATTLVVTQDAQLSNGSTLEVGNASGVGGTSILRLAANLTAASGTTITNSSSVASGDSIEFIGTHSPAQVITLTGATVYSGTRLHYQVKSTATAQLSTSSNLSIGGMLNIEGAGGIFDINGNTLTLNGNITGTGTLSGSSSSVLSIGGTSGGNLGTLYFTSGAQSLNNLTLNRTGGGIATLGTDLRVYGTGTFTSGAFEINGNTLRINNGSFSSGTLTGSSSSNLTIDGTGGSMKFTGGKTTLKDLLLNASATATLADSLDITAGAAPGSVTVATGSTLTTNDKLTLKSDVNGTSRVGRSSGAISGKAIVERYLNIGTTAYSRRWHLLTAPFQKDGNAQTINEAWQEGTTTGNRAAPANPNSGYGVLITKSTADTKASDGFDQGSTNNPSIYALTPGTSTFTVPTNLYTTKITDNEGYMLFVRGDRSIIIGSQFVPANATNLRAKGNLFVGNDVQRNLTTGRNFIGNPYASAIKMDSVEVNGTVFSSSGLSYYYWDPKMTPSGTLVGKFITVKDDGIPGFTSYSVSANTSGLADGTIESGMAINFTSAGGANTMIFHEKDKISASSNLGLASRPIAGRPVAVPGLYKLYTSLYAADGPDNYNLADGVVNTFYPTYTNAVDEKDATKLSSFNQKEDLSVIRDGKNLAIETRLPVVQSDTVFLQTKNMDNKNYQFHFLPQNFNPSIGAFIEDTYTGIKKPINTGTSAETVFDFSVNTNIAASANPNRFRIVFLDAQSATLPVTISSIKAAQQNSNISVDWKVENEVNIKSYVVERSVDGIHFTAAGTINAAGSSMYNWLDKTPADGNNYYRIRSVNQNGEIAYSQIVRVSIGKQAPSLTVYPTVITNGKAELQLNNMPKGRYDIRLINAAGQLMSSQQLTHAGGSATETIQTGKLVAKGIYQLEVIQPDHTKTTLKLVNQ